ncbi:hypothetical protein CCM_04071 [Cordyceps militaris CM01]|uniref:Uncharacterized protein n=1 Tax=Cordyceps militaris (strain CM01) TaxID=983644 RepID=G3JDM3_CORMM|nr:uncharacterized protein CCM_04071 [Cordyceps militaris CM01]EGX92698.1 hypothetical protein CCM_04071 [Cordyceps militaris CM01]
MDGSYSFPETRQPRIKHRDHWPEAALFMGLADASPVPESEHAALVSVVKPTRALDVFWLLTRQPVTRHRNVRFGPKRMACLLKFSKSNHSPPLVGAKSLATEPSLFSSLALLPAHACAPLDENALPDTSVVPKPGVCPSPTLVIFKAILSLCRYPPSLALPPFPSTECVVTNLEHAPTTSHLETRCGEEKCAIVFKEEEKTKQKGKHGSGAGDDTSSSNTTQPPGAATSAGNEVPKNPSRTSMENLRTSLPKESYRSSSYTSMA